MIPLALAMSDAPDRPEDTESDPSDATPFRPPTPDSDEVEETSVPPEPEPLAPDASFEDVLDEDPEYADEPGPLPLPDPAYDHELEPAFEPESFEPDPPETDSHRPELIIPEPVEPEPASIDAESRIAPPAAPPGPSPKRPPLQRAAIAILLIAAAGMIGYVLSTTDERPDEPNALTRSVEAAGNLRLLLRTDVPAEAHQFVREEFGWRIGVPLFDAVSLTGVAIAQPAAAVEVPVFLYADDEDQNVAVFAYSYALLDQVPDRLRLTDSDYEDLADGTPAVRETNLGDVLLWRDRDDIYVAVTDLPPADLVDGLTMDR